MRFGLCLPTTSLFLSLVARGFAAPAPSMIVDRDIVNVFGRTDTNPTAFWISAVDKLPHNFEAAQIPKLASGVLEAHAQTLGLQHNGWNLAAIQSWQPDKAAKWKYNLEPDVVYIGVEIKECEKCEVGAGFCVAVVDPSGPSYLLDGDGYKIQ